MRDIEFRAKTEVEGWLYGNIIHITEDYKGEELQECDKWFLITPEGAEFETQKETIGQFTEMYDKNGKKIYEGDIVLTQPCRDKMWSEKAKYKRLLGIVKYNVEHTNKFGKSPEKIQYWDAGWKVEIVNEDDEKKYSYRNYSLFYKCEVVGNIHDNKDLLGGGEWS